jgi:hypothetical protein
MFGGGANNNSDSGSGLALVGLAGMAGSSAAGLSLVISGAVLYEKGDPAPVIALRF